MKQIEKNPEVAICGEWFTAYGIGENLGWVRDESNADMMSKLRTVFAEWYDNGHINENDPNTCLLRIRLTDGILFHNGLVFMCDDVNKTYEELCKRGLKTDPPFETYWGGLVLEYRDPDGNLVRLRT